MAHKISDVNYTQKGSNPLLIFFSLMIPHEGQGNGRAELLGSMILNTVLQHNQHFAFLFFSNFLCVLTFSLTHSRARVFLIDCSSLATLSCSSGWVHFLFHFICPQEEISYSLSSPPDLAPFLLFLPFSIFFFLLVCRMRDMGERRRNRDGRGPQIICCRL